jgi:hypothetical protein
VHRSFSCGDLEATRIGDLGGCSLLTQGSYGTRMPHGNRVPFAKCMPLNCLPRGGPIEGVYAQEAPNQRSGR